jgi:formylglycine-generating enzyme required for sulfatase activity
MGWTKLPTEPENHCATVSTSRKVGFSSLPGFVVLEIEPLTIDQQRQLMIAICGEEKTALLLRNIAGAHNLQDMAGVPLALTVLGLVARESEDNSTDFLQYNTDLFKFGTQILLEGRHRGNIGVLNPENAELILARASFHLHGNKEGMQGDETFTATKVESTIMTADQAWLLPWQGPRHFIKDVASHSSLIYPTDTLNQRYRYLHRTFREYFAALELSRLNKEQRQSFIRQVLNQQQWAEVLVLLGGLTADVEGYLYQLLKGPSDLALRTLKEVKKLNPKLATEILQLKPGSLQERRQAFIALTQKLRSPEQIIGVLRAYLDATKDEVPRADLYFIQEILQQYNIKLAKDLLNTLFKYLPKVTSGLIDSVTTQGEILPYFCDIPAGPFLLGGARNDPSRPSWVSIHTEIYISPFQIGCVPVTNLVYEVFDPRHRKIRDFQDEVSPEELDYHPVSRVSWYEAAIFCQWLAQTIPEIRLPTEAEWEKAASWSSDGKKRRFPWGDDWDPSLLNCWQSGPNRTTRVALYPKGKSPCGAFDMAGNVWEWCSDWFEDNLQSYFETLQQAPQDPRGPEIGTRRVDRGGGWYHDVGLPCTFLRAADDPADDFSHCGFRLARSLR